MSKRFFIILFFMCAEISAVYGDCIKNYAGQTVCGKGKCMQDHYKDVFCAPKGGGIIKNRFEKPECGLGPCKTDINNRSWCGRKNDTKVIKDKNGIVQCDGGCVPAEHKLCVKPH